MWWMRKPQCPSPSSIPAPLASSCSWLVPGWHWRCWCLGKWAHRNGETSLQQADPSGHRYLCHVEQAFLRGFLPLSCGEKEGQFWTLGNSFDIKNMAIHLWENSFESKPTLTEEYVTQDEWGSNEKFCLSFFCLFYVFLTLEEQIVLFICILLACLLRSWRSFPIHHIFFFPQFSRWGRRKERSLKWKESIFSLAL